MEPWPAGAPNHSGAQRHKPAEATRSWPRRRRKSQQLKLPDPFLDSRAGQQNRLKVEIMPPSNEEQVSKVLPCTTVCRLARSNTLGGSHIAKAVQNHQIQTNIAKKQHGTCTKCRETSLLRTSFSGKTCWARKISECTAIAHQPDALASSCSSRPVLERLLRFETKKPTGGPHFTGLLIEYVIWGPLDGHRLGEA